jgi:hypothetical protein
VRSHVLFCSWHLLKYLSPSPLLSLFALVSTTRDRAIAFLLAFSVSVSAAASFPPPPQIPLILAPRPPRTLQFLRFALRGGGTRCASRFGIGCAEPALDMFLEDAGRLAFGNQQIDKPEDLAAVGTLAAATCF